MFTSLLAGTGIGLSLIVAIGAQNLFVLRQGLRREHAVITAAICAVSDAILIAVGVGGLGVLVQSVPSIVDVARWAGAAFLIGYAALAARRAVRPAGTALTPQDASAAHGTGGPATAVRPRLMPVAMTTLALTWLSPHVYLDTVFLLGSVASTHGDDRWWFAAGAAAASIAWFFTLAAGARLLAPLLADPRAWRVLDAVVAVVMVAIAVGLILPR